MPVDTQSRLRSSMVYLGIFLLAFMPVTSLVTLLFAEVNRSELPVLQSITHHPVHTVGSVNFLDLNNHGSWGYIFRTSSGLYTGHDLIVNGESNPTRMKQRVPVVYDRLNPNYSCSCNLHEALTSWSIKDSLAAGILMGSVAGAIAFTGVRKHRQRSISD